MISSSVLYRELPSEILVILLVLPLDFSARFFLFISIVFMIIHENSEKNNCLSNHHIKVLYLQINLIQYLLFYEVLLLRYEYFCRYPPGILKSHRGLPWKQCNFTLEN